VLVIVPTAGYGGVERVSVDLMSHASKERFDVRALFLDGGPMADEARARGIPVDVAWERTGLEPLWHRARLLTRRIRRAQPDLIHVTGFTPLLETLVAGRMTRTPVVWHQQDPHSEGFDWKRFALVTATPPAATIFGTHVARNVISPRIPTLRRTHLITNGVVPPDAILGSDETRQRLGLHPKARLVTMVSRLEPLKGPQVLVRAVPAIVAAAPDVQVVVAGPATATELAELRRLADVEGVLDRVAFTGPLTDELKWGLLAESEVVVHPSLYEPFGLVIVEAMFAGTPVVAARSWGPEWIIDSGRTGLRVESGDSEQLASSAVWLLEHRDRAFVMTKAATLGASERFRFDRSVRELERVWSLVL
jgi:glycosyltransferase involved in cell wall biosynthesis